MGANHAQNQTVVTRRRCADRRCDRRSNIVGKPLAQLLLRENRGVTIAHSQTRELPEECRRAGILVAAVGLPGMIRGAWIKPGATVVDVGINRIVGIEGKTRLVGDGAFDECPGQVVEVNPCSAESRLR